MSHKHEIYYRLISRDGLRSELTKGYHPPARAVETIIPPPLRISFTEDAEPDIRRKSRDRRYVLARRYFVEVVEYEEEAE